MSGFVDLLAAVVRANGMADTELQRGGALPGYFFSPARPWDLLVLHLLCQRLVRERLYTVACALTSPRTAADRRSGRCAELFAAARPYASIFVPRMVLPEK